MKTCPWCRYFNARHWEFQTDTAVGNCRKRAPALINDPTNPFPVVGRNDWCGDFEEEPNGQQAPNPPQGMH